MAQRPKPKAPRPLGASPAAAIAEAIRQAQRLLVCIHKHPDGDALGSAIAAVLALEAMGKQVVGYCPGPLLVHFHDIPGIERLRPQFPSGQPFDLALYLDCADLDRVLKDFKPPCRTVNIDHHKSNALFADLNWVDPAAAATGELLYALFVEMQVEITAPLAQALYLAIMTDTGSFRYANTRPETFEIVARLVQRGADPALAARLYWDNVSPHSVRLRAAALQSLTLEAGGRLAWAQLTAAQFAAHGGLEHAPEGLSSALRGIRGVEVGLLFTEIPGEGIRVSLRSHGNVDVSEIARQLGGGGHRSAAGAVIEAPLDEARQRTLAVLRRALAP